MNDVGDDDWRPLVFVHLSDLHFRESGSPLAEREAALRDLLLEDIPKVVGYASGQIEAILLTGDLARAGQSGEYREARLWLDELCRRIGIHPTKTLTVPGNHDVDWTRLDPGRMAINAELRSCDAHLMDGKIDALLTHPDLVMGPLENYQEFAAAYACDINNCLAWDLPPLPLGRGYALAIRGANSVINSDTFDGEHTMAVQLNQLLVRREPGLVRMLMMHHSPPFWHRPNPTPAQCGHNIVLYGHTHQAEHHLTGATCLEVTAGAVHPEEKEEFAVPGYNVIEISVDEQVDGSPGEAYARVRVFHRDFSRTEQAFIETGTAPAIDERIEILRTLPATAPDEGLREPSNQDESSRATAETEELPDVTGVAESQPPLETEGGMPDPSRVVRAAFESLGAGDRLRVLDRVGIPRAEVAGLLPHRQIREVARIVVQASLVDAFLDAVLEVVR